VIDRIQRDIELRDVTLNANLASLEVVSDGQKIERVFENLLDNARKFTPDGGRITVNSGLDASESRAWVEVSNNVENLEADELPLLFDRFYRRDRSRSAGGRGSNLSGSGLGLPIARDLVSLMGGTLIASLDGGQITFRVELPVGSAS